MSIAETMEPVRGPLFAALAKAQAKIKHAVKESKNPHFNSKYADLASVAEACREALTENGICVIQDPFTDGNQVGCITTLGHASGSTFESRPLRMVPRDLSPQTVGSCVTYLRRYQLASVVGVAPDDDDGNAAQGLNGPKGEAGAAKASVPRANTVKSDGKPASNDSIAKLMALKAQVGGMTPDAYQKQLAAFKKPDGTPCATAADLSQAQLDNLLARYEAKIAQQAQRASDVPDIAHIGPKPTLRDLLAKHFEDGEDTEWIHATFEKEHVQELNQQQATDAYALLDAFGDVDRFDAIATQLRAAGRIR